MCRRWGHPQTDWWLTCSHTLLWKIWAKPATCKPGQALHPVCPKEEFPKNTCPDIPLSHMAQWVQSYFQPALQGDIASYTSSQKWHVSGATLAGGPAAQPPAGWCSPLEFPVKSSHAHRARGWGCRQHPLSCCLYWGQLLSARRWYAASPRSVGCGLGRRQSPKLIPVWP